MDELALLELAWVLAVLLVLVCGGVMLGAVYAVFWLLWKTARWLARAFGFWLLSSGKGEHHVVERSDATVYAQVSGRVRAAGVQRDVRVQGRLVPASSCLAQRNLGGVERRRRRRARPCDE